MSMDHPCGSRSSAMTARCTSPFQSRKVARPLRNGRSSHRSPNLPVDLSATRTAVSPHRMWLNASSLSSYWPASPNFIGKLFDMDGITLLDAGPAGRVAQRLAQNVFHQGCELLMAQAPP